MVSRGRISTFKEISREKYDTDLDSQHCRDTGRMGVSVEEWGKLSSGQDMDLQNLHAKAMASSVTCMIDQ